MNSSLPEVAMEVSSEPGSSFLSVNGEGWRRHRRASELLKMRLPEYRVGEAEKDWLMGSQDQWGQQGWRDSVLEKDFYIFQDHPVEIWIETETTWLSGKLYRHTAFPWNFSPGLHLTWRKRYSPKTYKFQKVPRSVPNSLHLSPTRELPIFTWQRRGRREP